MNRWQEAVTRLAKRPVVVLTILAALLATQIRPWWLPIPDGCGYLSIARSIAHGGPVTSLGSPKLHFAPGYPLLASLAFLIDDHPFLLLSILQWLLAVAFMLGVYRWSKRVAPGAELWITALVMVNASLWMHVRLTISEAAFMAALIWTVEALHELAAAETTRAVCKWAALAALMTLVVAMTRQVGILVIGGYALAMLISAWQRRVTWSRALATTLAVGLPASAAVLALMAYESKMAAMAGLAHRTYLDYFHEGGVSWTAQIIETLRLRVSEAGRLLIPGMYKTYAKPGVWLNPNMAVYVALFVALAWSGWRMARSGANIFALSVPFYLGLYLVYPFDQGTRYLLPLLPLLMACLWSLIERIPRPYCARLCAVLVLLHLGVAAASSVRATSPLRGIDARWPEVEALAAVIHQDPEIVQAWHVPSYISEMLQLASDRRVEFEPADDIDPKAAWLIADVKAPDCPGFVETRAGGLKLLARVPQIGNQPQRTTPNRTEIH